MTTLSFYLGNSHLGTTEVAVIHPPMSIAYICPHCGEVWARIVVPGQQWLVDRRFCDKHKNLPTAWWNTRGGMFLSIFSQSTVGRTPDANVLEYLPRDVLLHDFLLLSETLNATPLQTQAAA